MAGGLIDSISLKAEKVRRLSEEGLRYYEPHAAQESFHKSQVGIRAICAGNQFGKTFAGCVEILWTIGKVHPYRKNNIGPVFARDCCVSFKLMQKVLIPTYKVLVPRSPCEINGMPFCGLRKGSWDKAWSEMDRMLYFEDGSFLEFLSYEQGREAFQGPRRHIIRIDEEPRDEGIWGENLARQATTGRNMLLTFTPLNYSQWLFDQVHEASATDDGVEMFTGHTRENPHALEEVVADLEKRITDPAERAARLHGEFTFLAGRVYKSYSPNNFIEPFPIPDNWHRSVIIDPHPQKATAVNWIAESPDKKLYCYNEADIEGDVEFICNEIAARSSGQYINLWLIDPSARQSAQIHGKGRLVDEFRKYFPSIIEANNNRDIGWEAVKRLLVAPDPLTGPKLLVFKSCPVTDFQMRNYSWKPPLKSGEARGKPEVFKKNDDHCDNIRYRAIWRGNTNSKSYGFGHIGVYANG